jgi:hypothetical protein
MSTHSETARRLSRAISIIILLAPLATFHLAAQVAERRNFDLPDVRGGHYRLLDRSGRPILIAFVDTAKALSNSPSLR